MPGETPEAAAGEQAQTPEQQAAQAAAARADAAPAPSENMIPQSRLDTEVGKKWEEKRRADAAERELALTRQTLAEAQALLTQQSTPAGDQTPPVRREAPLSPQELERRVRAEAQSLSAQQDYNKRCNEVVFKGREAHQDFDKVVLGDLTQMSPVADERTGQPTLPQPLILAALETGIAPEVLYALGKNRNEADRIMSLAPVAQAVAVASFAQKVKSEADAAAAAAAAQENPGADDASVSRAPAPKRTPTPRGSATPAWDPADTEHFSMDEWMRNREKDVQNKRARH